MKKITLLLIMLISKTAWVGEYTEYNKQFVGMIMLGLLSAQALAQDPNCTDPTYEPFTLTDTQTVTMAWWQIGSGLWAICMIINDFFAPWWFYRWAEKKRAKMIQSNIDYLNQEMARLKQNSQNAEAILANIREIRRRD